MGDFGKGKTIAHTNILGYHGLTITVKGDGNLERLWKKQVFGFEHNLLKFMFIQVIELKY